MFIKTVKVKKPVLIAVAVGIVALVVLLIGIGIAHSRASANSYELLTEAQRQSFLSDMGWEVSEKYTSCKVITIPEEFSDVYENYNALQKEQGFDLADFKGEKVEIYQYNVSNYPGKDKNMVANLIVCNGKLIGGDVCCTELDGFMQGLKKS
ncbi:MAG: DUF4830 domain-containing protein [Oscillospiraceae bacterium]